MYEELVNRLNAYSAEHEHHGGITAEAADAIEELRQTVEHYKGNADDWYIEACEYKARIPRWIPVTERLPEKRKWVLCLCMSNVIDVFRLEDNEWYHDPCHIYFPHFVTHWMPLPEPPKEELK